MISRSRIHFDLLLLQEDLLLYHMGTCCWLCGARDRDGRGKVGAGFALGLGDAGVRLFAMIYDWPALYYKSYIKKYE
jgi:hypothetical protein